MNPLFTILTLRITVLLVFATLILNSCRAPLELASQKRSTTITIDGNTADWQGATTPLVNYNGTIGLQYDDEFLYFCFSTADRQMQAQLLGPGITVWFDPEGKAKKSFGVQFPLGGDGPGRMMLPRAADSNPDFLDRLLQRVRPEMELLGPGEEHRRASVGQQTGVSVHLGRSQNILMYELKVPLKITGQYAWAIEADMTKPLSIGIETNEFSGGRAQSPQGQPAGGRRSRSSGGLASDPRMGEQSEPLKLWLHVTPAAQGL